MRRALVILIAMAFVSVLAATPLVTGGAFAANTGTWTTSGTGGSATAGGTTVTVSGVSGAVSTTQTLNATNFWSNPYLGGAVAGGPSLYINPTPYGTAQNITITFSRPVDNPVLHIDRLGGSSNTNASTTVWTLASNVSVGGTVTQSLLANSNVVFDFNGTRVQRNPVPAATGGGECLATNAGSACGSIQLTGTGITSVTFAITWAGTSNTVTGDGIELAVSLADPSLTLLKTVTNDNGGTLVANTVSLTATGPTTISGTTGAIAVTSATVAAGTYALTEINPAGYTAGAWTCTAGTLAGSNLTIAAGQAATCTINNNDIQPKLTVSKVSNGGTGTFTFTGTNGFTSQNVTTATTGVLVSGTQQTLTAANTAIRVTESLPVDYVLTGIACTGTGAGNTTNNLAAGYVDIAAGGTVPGAVINCTFTNAKKPKLTLVKNLVNTGGGTATLGNFTLSAAGPTPISGISGSGTVTSATVLTGAYAMSETGVTDYTASAWTCAGGSLAGSTVTLVAGDAATCTITNTFVPNPKLTVAKSAGAPTTNLGAITTATDALDTITYSYVINNTGNVPLTSVAPVDAGPKFNGIAGTNALSAFTPTSATIAIGGTQTFTATYVLSQADVNNAAGVANAVSNSATVSGKEPSGGIFTSPASTATATIAKASSLVTAKSAGAPTINLGALSTATDGSDTIAYSYAVTNTGNVTLTNVAPADAGPKFNGVTGTGSLSAFAPGSATLAPGATQNFTAIYTLTQADVNNAAGIANAVTNAATAAGKQPDGTTTTSPVSNATATIAKTSALTTAKSAAAPTVASGALNTVTDGGDKITYSYTVANTGNVTLTNVVPSDAGPKFNGLTGTGTLGVYAPTSTTLTPGSSVTFTAVYTLSQTDVDNAAGLASAVTNSATASGKQPDGSITTSSGSSATATIAKSSTLITAKSAAAPTTASGAMSTITDGLDTITYTYVVTNTGNVTLTNVVPVDAGPKFNGIAGTNTLGAYAPTTATLAPGASQSFTALYVLSQIDVNNGAGVAAGVTNTATTSGKQPDGITTTSAASNASTTIAKSSSLITAKSAAAPTVNLGAIASATDALDTITYTYTVTNTGNVTLTNVVPSDAGPKFNGVAGSNTLGSYTPASTTLAPGASQNFTATYVLSQTDVNNGAGVAAGVTNSAITSGKQPDGSTTTSPSSLASTTITNASGLTTSKSAGAPTIVSGASATLTDGGDKITYTYAVTNTGNVTLTNVVPADAGPKFNGIAGTGSLGVYTPALATVVPGATQNFTATYTLTQADVNNAAGLANAVTNSATASGKQPDGTVTTSAASNATATIGKTSSLSTLKSAGTPTSNLGASSTLTDGGDKITYSYTVTNTGNVSLTNVMPSDAGPTFNGVAGTGTLGAYAPASTTLAPGGAVIFTAKYTMTQADVNNAAGVTNGVANSATASGQQPDGSTTTSPTSSATATIAESSSLTAAKSAGAPTTTLGVAASLTDANDTITYTYTVTNTGNVSLTGVVPTDAGPKFNGVTGTGTLGAYAPLSANLLPGVTQSFTAVYTLTQTDVNNAAGLANAVTNSATASGTQPDGGTTTSTLASATATIAKSSSLTTAKSAAAPTVASGASATVTDLGDSITYSYSVTNTGNVTLTNVVPSDAGPQFNGIAGTGTLGVYTPTVANLAPGDIQVFTATYALTQTDINNAAGVASGVTNVATASGLQPDGSTTTSPSSSASATILEASSLSTSKSAAAPTTAVGVSAAATDALDTITYTYTVTNTGNVSLTNVVPVDSGPTFNGNAGTGSLGAFSPLNASLTPGSQQVFTAIYVLSQADVNFAAGVSNGVANIATSMGTQPDGGTTVSAASSATTMISEVSSLATVKTAGTATIANGVSSTMTDATDTITFTYVVTNTGNVTLWGTVPSDAGPTFNASTAVNSLSAYSPSSANLSPGQSQTFTATYILAQADVNAAAGVLNGVANTATASGTQPDGGITTSASSTAQTNVPKVSTLSVTKAAGLPTVAFGASATQTGSGDKITYTYTIKNTGNVTLTGVVPTDSGPTFNGAAMAGIMGAYAPLNATLVPGATQVFTVVYTLAQADVNSAAGITNAVSNTAAATGLQPDGSTTTGNSFTATTSISENSTLTLAKSAAAPTVNLGTINSATDGGDKITYTYTVKNTGNVTVSNVMPADVGPSFNSVTGTSALGVFSPPSATLTPGASAIFTAVYTLSQADVNNAAGIASAVSNTANASGLKPSGGTVTSPNATALTTINKTSNLTLSKTAAAPTTSLGVLSAKTDGGDQVTYTYVVKNTGNVTLTGVVPVDAGPTFNAIAGTGSLGAFTPASATLVPNTAQTFTAIYTLSQTDVDNAAGISNAVSNTATANGTQPGGATTTSPSATAKTSIANGPAMLVTKIADMASVSSLPATITYTVSVANTGNVTLTGVNLTDALTQGGALTLTSGPTLSAGDLNTNSKIDVNETWSYTATYAVTQANFNSGMNIVNAATVSTAQTISQTASATTTISQSAAIFTVKSVGSITTANGASATATDGLDVITYNYVVTNGGNITLTNVVPVDAGPNFNGVAGTSTLTAFVPATAAIIPGGSQLFTSTYVLSQTDVDNAVGLSNAVSNLALATGKKSDGSTITSTNSTANATIAKSSAITLLKTGTLNMGGNARADKNDTISYAFTITNTGNTTLTNVSIADALAGVTVSGGPLTLAPGAQDTTSITAVYTLTQADVNSGSVVNNATVTGKDPRNVSITASSGTTVNLPAAPALTIDKTTTSSSFTTAGDNIFYSYVITNSGNTTTTSPVSVSDNKITGGNTVNCDPWPPFGLAPNDTYNCTATYIATQADIDFGSVTNVASASDGTTTSPTDSVMVPAIKTPKISMVKTPTLINFGLPGDLVTYDYVVTNDGNTTITTPITITDNFIPVVSCPTPATTWPPAGLAPGASVTCTGTYTVTQDDLDIGSVVNIASGTDGTITTPPASAIIPANATPGLTLIKTKNDTSFSTLGQVVSYTYDIQNTGNVTLTKPIDIVDDRIGTFNCFAGNLTVGTHATCTHNYTIMQADLDRGFVTNVAYAKTTYGVLVPPTPVTSPVATQTIPAGATVTPGLTLKKTVTPAITTVGQTLTYNFEVKNAGKTTLTNVTVIDPLIPTLSCVIPSMLPGVVDATCNGNYIVTQADLDAGSIVNTATVNGVDPGGNNVSTSDTLISPTPIAAPSLLLTKTPSLSSFNAPNQVIGYVFAVKNTGNVTISNTLVTDPLIPSLNCTIPSLAPGATDTTCSATYTTLLGDVNAGARANTATAQGMDPFATPVNDTGSANVPAAQSPQLTLTKSGTLNLGVNVRADVGDTISYVFTVKNTGNVSLTNVSVSDPLVTVSGAAISLAPGALDISTFTGTYTLTQLDINAGVRPNTATTTGTLPDTVTTVLDTASATSTLVADPKLQLTKTGTVVDTNGNGVTDFGDNITYTFTVENTGNVTLTNVLVTDPLVTVSGAAIASMLPGVTNSTRFSATYALTQTDVDAGVRANTASVTGKPPVGANATASDAETKVLGGAASITLAKSGTLNDGGDGRADVGDTVSYAFTVTNTGNVTLTNVVVTDPKVMVAGGPVLSLAPLATDATTFTASYVLTQIDIDAGNVNNVASVSGTPPTGADVIGTGIADTALSPMPAITLLKDSVLLDGGDGRADLGDVIHYTFTVTNTGNVTLSGVVVTDPMVTVSGSAIASLVVGAVDSTTFTADYTLTQIDVDAGQVLNSASVKGTPPTGADVTGPASKTTTLDAGPSLTLVKSGVLNAGANGVADVGETISYDFTVKNSGNVTLTGVVVIDPLVTVTGAPITMLPGDISTGHFAGTYVLTQLDIDAAQRSNAATVTGITPSSSTVTAPGDTTTLLPASPKLTLVKAGTLNDGGDGIVNVGDSIDYVFTVSNPGNVTLTNVKVTDPLLPALTGNPLCTIASLAPAATNSACTATYTLTQTDVDAGTVVNTATVVGTPPTGADLSTPSTATTPLSATPAMTFTKVGTLDPGVDGRADVNDTVTYVFTVKNTGNVTLSNVTVSDPLVTVSGGPLATLSVGATDATTFSAVYALTLADINAGTVFNTAIVSGNPPTGPPITKSGSNTTPLGAASALQLTKTGTVNMGPDGVANVGDVISYAFRVENTGNVTLTNVVVTDPPVTMTGGPIASLAPGAIDTTTYQATHVMTQADIDAGTFSNTAAASGNPPNGPPATTAGSVTKAIAPLPAISLVKVGVLDDGGNGVADVGDVINYTFTVKNTGNVTLTNVVVTDPTATMSGSAIASLAPGISNAIVFTAQYTLTLADINTGTVANTATADGTPPTGAHVTGSDTVTTSLSPTPSISLTKVGTLNDGGDGVANINDTISYVFTVENTGNVTLYGVTVTDPMVAVSGGPIAVLPPGTLDALTFTAVYALTAADVNTGTVVNNASVKGSPPTGVDITSPAVATNPLTSQPSLSVAKSGTLVPGVDGRADAGDVINYTFTITNTGNVALTNVTLTDPGTIISGGPIATLAAGAIDGATFTATHILTAAEITSGAFNNVATVTGSPPSGADVSAIGNVSVPLTPDPQITLSKVGTLHDGGDGAANVGDTISYAFTVSNTGNVPLTNVLVNDPLTGTVTGGPITLAAGSTVTNTFTATYTLTATDVNLGVVNNAASVRGTPPTGADATTNANTSNLLPSQPSITLIKTGTVITGADLIADIGDTVTYAFTVKNTGNVVLNNVIITDPKVIVSGTPITLAAGASDATHFTATYTLTSTDIDLGKVDNTATTFGTPPTGADVSAPGSISTPVVAKPSITLAKIGTLNDGGDGVANVGDTIAYVFTMTNSGNVTLGNVVVTDPLVTVAGGPIASFGAGASDALTFTANYTLTAADVNAGKVDNTALASGTPPVGGNITAPGSTSTLLTSQPSITLSKIGTLRDGGDGVANIGDTITYAFTVKNTGNVDLTNVVLTDPLVAVSGGPLPVLAAGATDATTFTATYVLTAIDVNAGKVDNTASVTGKPPLGADVSATGPTSTPLVAKPSLQLTKLGTVNTGSDGVANVGDSISYVFTVKNTGNVTLTNVKVTDPKVTVIGGPIASLSAGVTDALTFSAIYVLTSADVDFSKVDNSASVTGTPPTGADVSATDATSTPTPQLPLVALVKTGTLNDGGDGVANIGDKVTYVFAVTNTGNVSLSNVVVSDPLVTVSGGPIGNLAAGATDTATFTAVYTLQAIDVDAGKVDNTASVKGKPPTGPDVTAPGSTSTPLAVQSGLALTKTGTLNDGGDGVANVGDTISYVFTVQNTGNVSLSNVVVTDPLVTVSGGPLGNLAAGATDNSTFTADYTLKAIDVDAGKVDNTANVAAKTPAGVDITSPGSTSTPLASKPGIAMIKSSVFKDENGDGFAQVGETIVYVFTVQNTGNVSLNNVTVTDLKVMVTGGPLANLAAGARDNSTFTALYSLTIADVDAGKVDNTADVAAKTPAGADVKSTGSTSTRLLSKAINAVSDFVTVQDGTVASPNVLNVLTGDTLGAVPATLANVTISVDPNAPVPPEMMFDPLTGVIGVKAGTQPATYFFNYIICEIGNPLNCSTATASVTVSAPAQVSGTVFLDQNSDGKFNDGEPKAPGYGVRIVGGNGVVLASAVSDANGDYAFAVPPGSVYTVIFSLPGGGADIGSIVTPVLGVGAFIVDQNLPIDPSGIVYDAVTRLPVAGATVILTDASGTPLAASCMGAGQQNQVTGVTGSYRFDILPGAAAQCPLGATEYRLQIVSPAGYLPGYAASISAQAGSLNGTTCPIDPSAGGSCEVSPSSAQPPIGTPGIYFTRFMLRSGDADVVNNHLPLQPVPAQPATFTKTSGVGTAKRGDVISYVIEANNVAFTPARFVDVIPASFNFVAGSANVNGAALTPVVDARTLTFNGLVPDGTGRIRLTLKLVVGSNVIPGPQINNAQFINPATGVVVAKAKATVEIVPEHVFDCGDIIGKVFDDKNRNGYQDEGEPGLPGVRLVTVKGLLITTDSNGRFHVGCADVPDADIGSNFILKLDTRTLPTGYRVTTENPRTVRLTRGKVTKLNFGASISRVIRLDMTKAMFADGAAVSPKLVGVVQQLVGILDAEPSTLRLTYYANGEGADAARRRLSAVQALVNSQWKKKRGRYKLPIEARIVGVK